MIIGKVNGSVNLYGFILFCNSGNAPRDLLGHLSDGSVGHSSLGRLLIADKIVITLNYRLTDLFCASKNHLKNGENHVFLMKLYAVRLFYFNFSIFFSDKKRFPHFFLSLVRNVKFNR